jgi:hypothetical protein
MKKILLTSILSVGALGLHAQGVLFFTDYGINIITHIYSPNLSAPTTAQVTGNTGLDSPTGSTAYPNAVLLGGANASGANGVYNNGADWTVQVEALGGQTLAVALSSLVPVTQYTTTLATSVSAAAGAGQWAVPAIASDPGVPNSPGLTPTADLAVACWYSGPTAGGLVGVSSLAAAETTPGAVWGETPEVVDFALAPVQSEEPAGSFAPTQAPDLTTPTFGLTQTAAPEPSTIALGVMAASAFIVRRRKS